MVAFLVLDKACCCLLLFENLLTDWRRNFCYFSNKHSVVAKFAVDFDLRPPEDAVDGLTPL